MSFFFLGRLLGLLDGPQAADLAIDIDQLAGQGLELAELSDFTFRLTDGGQRGQVLCNRLALDLLGELKMRAVCGVIRFGAMANRTSAAPGRTDDGTWLEVAVGQYQIHFRPHGQHRLIAALSFLGSQHFLLAASHDGRVLVDGRNLLVPATPPYFPDHIPIDFP